jgi:POT family proton-dependent oligopeptide transporter
VFGTDAMPSYKVVFIAWRMLISLVWFYIGRAGLKGIGAPPPAPKAFAIIMVLAGAGRASRSRPAGHRRHRAGLILGAMFTALAVLLLVEGIRGQGAARPRDRHADHLRLQRDVLDVLRTGRQLVHLPGREHRQPPVR